ncbi:unnamed protein product [Camellia sinensis]
MVPTVEAARHCSENLGGCNSAKDCKSKHSKGWSHCVVKLSCTCFYSCPRGTKLPRPHPLPPMPPLPPGGGGDGGGDESGKVKV